MTAMWCHIVGGRPVPVAVARELGDDAFVKAVLRKGRRIPVELRTALELGPGLEGVACVEPGCGQRRGLE